MYKQHRYTLTDRSELSRKRPRCASTGWQRTINFPLHVPIPMRVRCRNYYHHYRASCPLVPLPHSTALHRTLLHSPALSRYHCCYQRCYVCRKTGEVRTHGSREHTEFRSRRVARSGLPHWHDMGMLRRGTRGRTMLHAVSATQGLADREWRAGGGAVDRPAGRFG